jgi:bacterial/archaeal transporter family protein
MSAIWALISAISFSGSNIVIKKSLSDVTNVKLLVTSSTTGFLLLFFYLIFSGIQFQFTPWFILLTFLFAIGELITYFSLFKAFAEGNVSIATSIIAIYPLLSTIFAVVFLSYSVTLFVVMMIVVLIVGSIMISVDWRDINKTGIGKDDIVKGLGWMFLSMILYAIYFPLLFEITTAYTWQIVLLMIKLFSTIILVVVFGLIRKEKCIPERKYIPQTSLMGIFEILGWSAYALASVSTDNAIIITALTASSTLFTAIFAYLVLRERLSIPQYIGIILITIGVIGITV